MFPRCNVRSQRTTRAAQTDTTTDLPEPPTGARIAGGAFLAEFMPDESAGGYSILRDSRCVQAPLGRLLHGNFYRSTQGPELADNGLCQFRLTNPVPHRPIETLADPHGELGSTRPKATGTPELAGNEDVAVGPLLAVLTHSRRSPPHAAPSPARRISAA